MIVAYWQDNLDVLSDELISEFAGMSTKQTISALMKDKRYFSRFGGYSISRLSKEVEGVSGWKWLDWFGHFNEDNFPWIYHSGLGWLYVQGSSNEQVWFYMPAVGWLGTTEEIWKDMDSTSTYLWLYEQSGSRWVAYHLEQPSGNTFWDPQKKIFFKY
ncbi:MAG: hypothetical protein CBC16_05870 [Verrucomicrobia bacterium TMED56]|nr:MAG: hypothetical protein CBC16_05870 [Verrucomicrobia bacterium TMED56]